MVQRGLVLGALLALSLVSLLPLHLGLRSRGEQGVAGARNNGRYAPRA
jgi:hypothetical protein